MMFQSTPTAQSRPRTLTRAPAEFDRQLRLQRRSRLFWIRGYEATSIADLTETMGIGTKSLYAAFGSKDALYAEALKYYYTTYEGLVWTPLQGCCRQRGEAALPLLQDLGDRHDRWRSRSTPWVHGDARDRGQRRTCRTGRTHARPAPAASTSSARFDRAKSDGDLKATADTTKLARFVQTVQSGMAIRARDGADRDELHAVAEIALFGWDPYHRHYRSPDAGQGVIPLTEC